MADITGTPYADNIQTTDENDTVDSGSGADNVRTEGGDDVILAGTGRDKVYAGDGDDVLFGNQGDDRLYGGTGNDTLYGGADDDVLYGDNPNDANDDEGFADVFVFDMDDGNDKVQDFEVGIDKLQFTGGDADDLSFAYVGATTVITYGATTVTVYGATLDADDIGGDIIFA